MSDARIDWLIRGPLASLLVGVNTAGGTADRLANDAAVIRWLNENAVKLLTIYTIVGNKDLHCTNDIAATLTAEQQQQHVIDQEVSLVKIESGSSNANTTATSTDD